MKYFAILALSSCLGFSAFADEPCCGGEAGDASEVVALDTSSDNAPGADVPERDCGCGKGNR